jgi:hypothetical protein
MNLGPTFSMLGKCRRSLQPGQQAPPLARLDYLRAEGTFVYFLGHKSRDSYWTYIFEVISPTYVL